MALTRDGIRELKQRRAQLVAEGRQILERAESEGTTDVAGRRVPRDLTPEEDANWNRCHEDERRLGAQIDREERQLDADERMAASTGTLAGQQDRGAGDGDLPAADQSAVNRAFDSWLRRGLSGLDPNERAAMESRFNDLSPEQRALAAGTDTAGGFTVPMEMLQSIVVALKAYGGIRRSRATVITTSTGADLPFPTSNDTSNKGARIGENKPVTQLDMTFGQKVLKSFDYSSKLILVSYRLLQDSAINIQSFLSDRLAERLGRIMNEEDTVGSGASMPQGIVSAAASGKVGASATAITFDEMYDLLYSVNADYRENAELMFNDNTLKILKKLKDGMGRYLWQSGVAVREPDTIDRYPYIINYDMADMGSNAKSIVFGDMSYFYLRDVAGIQMIQLRERFADSLQVGFMAFMRHDAGLIDAGTNPVKYFQNAA